MMRKKREVKVTEMTCTKCGGRMLEDVDGVLFCEFGCYEIDRFCDDDYGDEGEGT